MNTHHKRNEIGQQGRDPAAAAHFMIDQGTAMINSEEDCAHDQRYANGGVSAVCLSERHLNLLELTHGVWEMSYR